MRPVVPLILLAAVSQLLNGCEQAVSREVLATVLSTRGQVVCANGKTNDFHPLKSETEPGGGDTLRTLDGGQLSLVLVPGALVQMDEDSELKIQELRLRKDGNETEDGMRNRTARIQLNHGSIDIVFQRGDESEIRFVINTGEVTVSATEDCTFQVQVQMRRGRVTCARGKVYAQLPNSAALPVKGGYFLDWADNGATTFSVVDDARAQSDTADLLKAEAELRDLESTQHQRRPF
jgi:ferric-dicitrate binding protein FerR (iron transport regulator)